MSLTVKKLDMIKHKYLTVVTVLILATFSLIRWQIPSHKESTQESSASSEKIAVSSFFVKKQLNQNQDKKESTASIAPRFANKEDFFEQLQKASRYWMKVRGYHLAEDFINYDGPENYQGRHPYGYLKKSELAALAKQGDIDAKMLYAGIYLKDENPNLAYDTYKEVVVATEQTLPLARMGAFLITGTAYSNKVSDKTSQENEACALFTLMKMRNDFQGDSLLDLANYSAFSPERQAAIQERAKALEAEFAKLRQNSGLLPYENKPFEGDKEMGLPKKTFDELYAKYSKETDEPSRPAGDDSN